MTTPPPSNWLPGDYKPPAPAVDAPPPKKPTKQIAGGVAAIAVLIVILGVVTLNYEPEEKSLSEIMATATSQAPEESDEPTEEDSADIRGWSRAEARNACHDKVKEQLNSPGSAQFEGLLRAQISKTGDGSAWIIAGTVTAENLYGAELSSEYTCTVTPSSPDRASVNASIED